MSSITTSLINTANGTTSLGLRTGNTGGPRIELNTINQITLKANSTVNTVIANTTGVTSTVPLNVNGAITAANATITSNTFTLGSSSIAPNGFTTLPNGLKMAWGNADITTSTTTVTYASPFSSIVYSINLTPQSSDDVWITASNTTSFTADAVSNSTVYYMAIGV